MKINKEKELTYMIKYVNVNKGNRKAI